MGEHNPVTQDQAQEAINALTEHGGITYAAKALGMAVSTLQNRVRVANRMKLKSTVTPETSFKALRGEIGRLEQDLKRLAAERADNAKLKELIGTAVMDLDTLHPPAWTFKHIPASNPGVPTLFLSDFHWGEKVYPKQVNGVNEYGMAVARKRLKFTIETAIRLCKILDPQFRYPGLVMPLGGDMISGDIHEELARSNEAPQMPVVLDLVDNLVPAIKLATEAFGQVFLPCVGGNHGRNTHKIFAKNRNHTSFDWLLYQFLARRFADDKRVTFYIPEGPDAYYRVFNHKYLLTHGDQFRGGDGMIGALGPIIRGDHKKRSRNAQISMDYDTMILGHWHQYIQLNRLIVNGSLKGYDEYAYSNNFGFEPPTQALWVTHPEHGITYRMPVYCEEGSAKSRDAAGWVSLPK